MALENKLGITESADLAREEEKISKKKAIELFESGYLDSLEPGTYLSRFIGRPRASNSGRSLPERRPIGRIGALHRKRAVCEAPLCPIGSDTARLAFF